VTAEVARLTAAGSAEARPTGSNDLSRYAPRTTNVVTTDPRTGQDFSEALKFSAHALKRLEQRGIELSGADVNRLEHAMDKAQAKGGKDSLILMGDLALIVSVKNRVVVTALDPKHQKEGVFTNIDSVVIG
jgi:flagellar operon protein